MKKDITRNYLLYKLHLLFVSSKDFTLQRIDNS